MTGSNTQVYIDDLLVEDISYSYAHCEGSRHAVHKASFRLSAGELVGLIGPNGAGKTTLAKLLAGVLRPLAGGFRYAGATIQPYKQPARCIGYAFQNPDDQLFASSVSEELRFGASNVGCSTSQINAAIQEVAPLLIPLTDLTTHPLDLPFVMRKRLSVAAALAMNRPFTILDEPSVGQDINWCNELYRVLRSIICDGRTIVIMSHDPDFLFEIVEHVILMEGARVAFQGSRNAYASADHSHWAKSFVSLPMYLGQNLAHFSSSTFDEFHQRFSRKMSKDI